MELTTSIKIRMDLPKSSVLLVPRSNKIIVLISEFGTFSNLDFLKYLPANNWEVETIMNKYLPLFGNVALCSILLSVGTAYSNETVLTPVPQNRIFISTTVPGASQGTRISVSRNNFDMFRISVQTSLKN